MPWYAHTAERPDGKPDPDRGRWQLLADHLRNVAQAARVFAEPMGLADDAQLAGYLHDLGKYAARFQDRLGDPRIRGINHWSVGAQAAIERRSLEVALAIEGHHTGMPALADDDLETGLQSLKQRLAGLNDPKLAPEINGFPEFYRDLLLRHGDENPPLSIPPSRPAGKDFATALRTRMLFSCLVDADFLDTERHFEPGQTALRRVPGLEPARALARLEEHLGEKPAEGPINELRRRLLADSLAAAALPCGLFSLTAPTGSGKTLASLAFALTHAVAHQHRRVIVVIPYTSIIEQTAAIFRTLFEPVFGPHYVLEHHSAVVPAERPDDLLADGEEERFRRTRLAQENWESPVVVTTNVQFFESLFGHKPSQCRKLHNITRSVVLFDEVQTLPTRLVPSLLSAVNLLVKEYGVTAVFGTATQPAFASAGSALLGGWNPVEISSRPRAMAEAFRRTRIVRRPDTDRPSWAQLAAELARHPRVLCVVNLRRHARDLFRALGSGSETFHLSASMCPAHRQAKLEAIRQRLTEGVSCRLISTQLIEAGVDVDFPRVYRALGPLDSIIQSAGRCNREGRLPKAGEVIVFRPQEEGRLPIVVEQAKAVTESFLADHPDLDWHRPETYAEYFARYYRLLGPDSAKDDPAYSASANLHFPAAARAARLVGDETRAVLVPWGEGVRIIETFRREKHLSREDWRLAHRFSVSFYHSRLSNALKSGEVLQPEPRVDLYVWNGLYDEDLGAVDPDQTDFLL